MNFNRRMTAVTVSGFSQKLGIEIAEKKQKQPLKLGARLASYGGEHDNMSKFLKNDIINEKSEYIDYGASPITIKAPGSVPNEESENSIATSSIGQSQGPPTELMQRPEILEQDNTPTLGIHVRPLTLKENSRNPIASDDPITELDYYDQSQVDSGNMDSG